MGHDAMGEREKVNILLSGFTFGNRAKAHDGTSSTSTKRESKMLSIEETRLLLLQRQKEAEEMTKKKIHELLSEELPEAQRRQVIKDEMMRLQLPDSTEKSTEHGPEAYSECDPVNHPSHYTSQGIYCRNCGEPIECIDVIESMTLNRGNSIKYVWRAGAKGGSEKIIEDLEKAVWYLSREIHRLGNG